MFVVDVRPGRFFANVRVFHGLKNELSLAIEKHHPSNTSIKSYWIRSCLIAYDLTFSIAKYLHEFVQMVDDSILELILAFQQGKNFFNREEMLICVFG